VQNIQKKKTKRDALKSTSEIIKKKLFVSKDPIGLAVAIVYMAYKKMVNIFQYQFANSTGIILVTLRKNKILMRILKSFMIFVCF